MRNVFVTIIGIEDYYGLKPFKVGRLCKIVKEEDNFCDREAIRVELPAIDTVGYIANTAGTTIEGTVGSSRLYDKIDDYAYLQVMFITTQGIIGMVVPPEDVERDSDIPPIKETETNNTGKTKNKIGF
jgi:hypothetical protein